LGHKNTTLPRFVLPVGTEMACVCSMREQTIEMLFLPVFIPVPTKENINVSFAKLISLVRPNPSSTNFFKNGDFN
jgi:hypothetical protein